MIEGRAFLTFARSLEPDLSEASKRRQISRAYYAAFLEARQVGLERAFHVPTRRPHEHADVANGFGAIDPKLKLDLTSLRTLRNGADYDLHLDFESITRQAEEAIRLAASNIERIDEKASELSGHVDETNKPNPDETT